jgi:acetyl esterase
MALDPGTAGFLEQLGGFSLVFDTDEEVAAFLEGLAGGGGAGSNFEGDPEPVADVRDLSLPGPDGEVPVRVYRPDGESLPLVVFFHGGVFILGGLEMHDPVLRRMANAIPAVIVSVDYRLAPAHTFPAALEDGFAALTWAVAHASELGGDADRLVVMGDSAGGALAALQAVRARDEGGPAVHLQVLLYPMIDPALDTPSASEFAEGYMTTRSLLEVGWKAYLNGQDDQPYATPAGVTDLAGLPPAIVITAGYDPLRDEGLEYIRRLERVGVEVVARHYPGQIHGFAFMPAVIPEANDALAELAALMRACLSVAAE